MQPDVETEFVAIATEATSNAHHIAGGARLLTGFDALPDRVQDALIFLSVHNDAEVKSFLKQPSDIEFLLEKIQLSMKDQSALSGTQQEELKPMEKAFARKAFRQILASGVGELG